MRRGSGVVPPSSSVRYPSSRGRHTLSCTPFPEEPNYLRRERGLTALTTMAMTMTAAAPARMMRVHIAASGGTRRPHVPSLLTCVGVAGTIA